MTFSEIRSKIDAIEQLTRFLRPLQSIKLSKKATHFLNTKESKYVILRICEETNSYAHHSRQARSIFIYGLENAKKDACKRINDYLNDCLLDFENQCFVWPVVGKKIISWLSLGKLRVNGKDNLPEDFLLSFKQHHGDLSEHFFCACEVHVDCYHKEIWVKAMHATWTMKQHRYMFCNLAKLWLAEAYNIHARSVELVDDVDSVHILLRNREATPATERELDEELTCVVCYNVPDVPYSVESCGHTYCTGCFESQLVNAVKGELSLFSCVDCDEPFSVADLENAVVDLRVTSLTKLLKTARQRLLRDNPRSYRECPKPNCDGISRLNKMTNTMICSLCSHRLCPLCLEEVHTGMTCEEYQSSALSIGRWLRAQKDRKICSHCGMGIERISGCNNVYCAYCRKSLCWLCLIYFDNSDDCYTHMTKSGHWRIEY